MYRSHGWEACQPTLGTDCEIRAHRLDQNSGACTKEDFKAMICVVGPASLTQRHLLKCTQCLASRSHSGSSRTWQAMRVGEAYPALPLAKTSAIREAPHSAWYERLPEKEIPDHLANFSSLPPSIRDVPL
jgi:hypothetical protein